MPQVSKRAKPGPAARRRVPESAGSARYTVGLAPSLARQVETYAEANDSSVSKAIATLVKAGLAGQEQRKRDFFKKLKTNLAVDDPSKEDELVDEFRALILGR